jgi:hypothetical protein
MAGIIASRPQITKPAINAVRVMHFAIGVEGYRIRHGSPIIRRICALRMAA